MKALFSLFVLTALFAYGMDLQKDIRPEDMLRIQVTSNPYDLRNCDGKSFHLVLIPDARVIDVKKEVGTLRRYSSHKALNQDLHVLYSSIWTLYTRKYKSDPLDDYLFIRDIMKDYNSASFEL